ncbi:MAG: ribonuclease P component 1 family protein [Candidatus Ranarchaeia archaeon]
MRKQQQIPRFNTLYRSLYGAYVEVVDARNPSLIGLAGYIIHETRQTLVLQTKKKEEKIVEKKSCLFRITFPGAASQVIHGRYLLGRVDERIKKHTRRI